MVGSKPDSPQADKLVVGKLTSPYGVKGWLKVYSFTEPASAIFDYHQLWVEQGGRWQLADIDGKRPHGKGYVAHIVGCDDRNQAALLAQSQLAVVASELAELPAEDYYWRELEDLSVYTADKDQPLLLGRVGHLFATGANDVMVVKATAESIDNRERLIPWVPGLHVVEVDLSAGRVTVDWDPDF